MRQAGRGYLGDWPLRRYVLETQANGLEACIFTADVDQIPQLLTQGSRAMLLCALFPLVFDS